MPSLAWKNLFHDKIRLIVTLTGVIFAVVLFSVQIGLFFGFRRATSDIVDHSNADLWVTGKDAKYLENGVRFNSSKKYKVLGIDDVAEVEEFAADFSQWKVSSGSEEGILLIGFNPRKNLGAPWNLTAGKISDLEQPDTVIIDELYKDKLKVSEIGESVEILGKRARVVGFTRGIRTFTTSPAVFTSFKNAQEYRDLHDDKTYYLLVKARPGADLRELKRTLRMSLSDVEVYSQEEFSRSTQNYWMFGTGAGVTVLIAAVLGLIVGVVVVAQTIYSATVDHIREYGTLKAMGASNFYLYRVIISQAAISAVLGYGFGISIALLVSYISQQGKTAIILPDWVVAILFGLTFLMCIGASVISINKVTRIDPAMVFKG
ncbi:MAG: ABC transporter permease [Pyrinomonadaceae bacterium]